MGNAREKADEADSLRSIADQAPGVVYQYVLRPDGTAAMPFATAGLREMFGVDPLEVREDAAKVLERIHPGDSEALRDSIVESARTLKPWRVELRIIRRDGAVRWVRGDSTPRAQPDGSILWHGFLIDVTERRETLAALRESRALVEGIIDAIPVRVFWKDRELRYLGCNAAFARDAGYVHPSELVGKDDFQMAWREQAELYRGDDRQVLETGKAKLLIEEPQTTPDGKSIVLLTSKLPLRGPGGEILGVIGTYLDVTQRKQAEAALARVRMLESIGTLAGGIAHDFNNILTAILGRVSLLSSMLPPGGEEQLLLREAESACGVAAGLANQLITFSQGGNPTVEEADLRPLIREAAESAARGSRVKVAFEFAEAMSSRVDRAQFSGVIRNLVLNAVEAMPDGGAVTLRGETVALDAGQASPLPAGRYVRVSVADDGPGIPAERLPRVFDPFFTTKPMGRGLGLAVCHSVMAKHGGRISAASAPGRGAVFTLLLPAAPSPGGAGIS